MTQLLVLALTCIFISNSYSETDINYRLNRTVQPISYDIAITPYFYPRFRFDGEVIILIQAEVETNQIQLHAENLTINALNISLYNMNGINIPLSDTNPLQNDTKYDFLYINLKNSVKAGDNFTLSIRYSGPIRDDLYGFYRNYFLENGIKKWLGATQMEPTHARKVFPCFDEPGYKAVFTLALDRPDTYKPSVANTRLKSTQNLNNGFVRETFYPTPRMSTYLVAFLISEFDANIKDIDGKELGIYSRPSTKNQTAYALEFGEKVVNALGDFFGIDYYSVSPNLKLDHVALTDFRAGAMENWGLVKYREGYLLYVPDVSTPNYKYKISQIIAHETTHMWFGDLVTCHWWSDTWLNEGFANYFQDYIITLIDPTMGSENYLVTSSVHDALTADEEPNPSPISNEEVNSPSEIGAHFGTITYSKAGSVIRMIHHLIGDDAFRYGLHAYLDVKKFDVGHPEDLYRALEEGVAQSHSLADYEGHTVTKVMSSWIEQPGHPVLRVEIDYDTDTVHLTQERLYSSPSVNKSDNLYSIPITYTTSLSPTNNTKPAFIMDTKTHSFNISGIGAKPSWVIFNVKETGLYRVNYDEHSWQIIRNALKENRESIHHLNRAKIVNDLFAFFYAEEVKFSLLVGVLDFLTDETDNAVWLAALRGFNRLRNSYFGSDLAGDVQSFALKKMENIIKKLGYEVKASDDYLTILNRMQILDYACKFGHTECVNFATQKLKALKEGATEIDPSFRPLAYCIGLRHGSGEDFDFLWKRMLSTNVANEARSIAEALGCTNDEERITSYLLSPLKDDGAIRLQDLTLPLSSVLQDYSHVGIVMKSLEENYTAWDSIYPMDVVISSVASVLRTEKDFNQFESWLKSCTECSASDKDVASSSLKKAKATVEWATKHLPDIKSTLRSQAPNITPPLLFILMLSYVLVLCN